MPGWVFGVSILLIFIGSQLYWMLRARRFIVRSVARKRTRVLVYVAALAVYFATLAYNFGWIGEHYTPTRLTVAEALLGAPWALWVVCSFLGFLIVALFWLGRLLVAGTVRAGRAIAARLSTTQPALENPGRRLFFERTTSAAAAVPFVAGAYGFLYGRLNLEITTPKIRLARLPRGFDGFRIAQLSDIHIGPFMPAGQIRRYAEITNSLKPDLIVLTGDFVTWDPSTQRAVVAALAGLEAPFGIYACLGNHEQWSHTSDSIAALFRAAGVPVLRHARVPLTAHGDVLNLIGVDFDGGWRAHSHGRDPETGRKFLEGVDRLMVPDTANILLSHNPNTFDRAAELGIDFSLAGHTHGGQVALEFISLNAAPSRLVTPYVSGWFEQPGGQLYVNRGIGTIGVPVRLGARPEISVFELVRKA